MKYILNKEEINKKDLIPISAEGIDGIVYKYHDIAIKILDSFSMTYEKAQKLMSIRDLRHIVMPTGIIIDEQDKYIGYAMRYIKKRFNSILNMSCEEFLTNLRGLEEDFELLATYIIEPDDLFYHQVVESDHIYLIDTDKYICHEKDSNLNIQEINKKLFDEFAFTIFKEQFINFLYLYRLDYLEKLIYFEEWFNSKFPSKSNSIETIKEELDGNERLKNYLSKIKNLTLPFN